MKAIYMEPDGTWVQDWDVEMGGMQSLPEELDDAGEISNTQTVQLTRL